ncbi:MAG: N-formylglutamate amidohydrolase [Anaerohalosphaeraceae bacterium]|nr:N-formylglutamate amidohydrolase [Anaerohalosphaeraceae bacterium]
MTDCIWQAEIGEGPLIAFALHSGHKLRDEVTQFSALDDQERLREEDPYTDNWTSIVPSRIIAKRSRFEVDLNRTREKAVYLSPEDA